MTIERTVSVHHPVLPEIIEDATVTDCLLGVKELPDDMELYLYISCICDESDVPNYALSFVKSSPADQPAASYSWQDLYDIAHVDGLRIIDPHGEEGCARDEDARIVIRGESTLKSMIGFFKDIAHCIFLGGNQPLSAGHYFQHCYSPRNLSQSAQLGAFQPH